MPIPYSERVGRSKLSVIRDGRVFLQSMVWTVLSYNPVRILGLIGLAAICLAALIFLALVIARLSGVTTLGPWGVVALFTAMIFTMAGISIFALGVTFNYLVSLFYKKPIRQGLFGKPIFKTPLDQQFWWMGLVAHRFGHAHWCGQPGAWPAGLADRTALVLLAGQRPDLPGGRSAHCVLVVDAGVGRAEPEGSAYTAGYGVGIDNCHY